MGEVRSLISPIAKTKRLEVLRGARAATVRPSQTILWDTGSLPQISPPEHPGCIGKAVRVNAGVIMRRWWAYQSNVKDFPPGRR
jgi:hypothetical protein